MAEYKDVEVFLAKELQPEKFVQVKRLLGSINDALSSASSNTIGVNASSTFVGSNTTRSVNGDFIVQGQILIKTPSNLTRGVISGGN